MGNGIRDVTASRESKMNGLDVADRTELMAKLADAYRSYLANENEGAGMPHGAKIVKGGTYDTLMVRDEGNAYAVRVLN